MVRVPRGHTAPARALAFGDNRRAHVEDRCEGCGDREAGEVEGQDENDDPGDLGEADEDGVRLRYLSILRISMSGT